MEKVITSFDLDLYRPTHYEVIKAQQNDTERYIKVTLTDRGRDYNLTNVSNIRFEGVLGDGATTFYADKDSGVSWANNIVTINIRSAITMPGIAHAKLILENIIDEELWMGEFLSSVPFNISVQKRVNVDIPEPKPQSSVGIVGIADYFVPCDYVMIGFYGTVSEYYDLDLET